MYNAEERHFRYFLQGTAGRIRKIVVCSVLLPVLLAASLLHPRIHRFVHRQLYIRIPHTDFNVILISVDTLRADHLGVYGYNRNTSPALDALAAESVMFRHAYTPWPKTTPSFASFFTGMEPFHTGVERISPHQYVPDNYRMLAEIFKNRGYRTFGYTANRLLSPQSNFHRGFDVFHVERLTAGEITDLAIDGLRQTAEQPFFLWVHYLDPHEPYKPPASYRRLFFDEYFHPTNYVPYCPPGSSLGRIEPGGADAYEQNRRWEINRPNVGCTIVKGPLDYFIAEYDAEIRYTDDQIRRLLDEIRRLKLMDRSVIVFWSDHGESLGDHDYYFAHGRFPYDACLHVPLFIRHPRIPPSVCTAPVSLTDVFPTLLNMFGMSADCDGRNLEDLLWGESMPRLVFAGAGYAVEYQKIMCDGRWKLIYVPDAIDRSFQKGSLYELYDTSSDPGEVSNLYSRDVPGMYLKEELDRYLTDIYRPSRRSRSGIAYDRDMLEELRSLGYMD